MVKDTNMLEKLATFIFRKSNADSRFLQNSDTYLPIGTQYHIPEDHNLKPPIVFVIIVCSIVYMHDSTTFESLLYFHLYINVGQCTDRPDVYRLE